MALMTVAGKDQAPSLDAAAQQLGVRTEDIDRDYGVVAVDPERGLYAVMVRADRLPPEKPADSYRGPFANPKIEPFGSP
jgi:hypothetical protein